MLSRIRTYLKVMVVGIKYRINLVGKQAVLIDTPIHDNIGDQAIALAEKSFLESKRISFFELPMYKVEYREKLYAWFTPKSKEILIQGGGFLGSLYMNEEEEVRRILKAFCKHKIVVFPQTIFFGDDEYIKQESVKCYTEHPDLTVFLRDQKSYDIMKESFPDVRIELCPDMVLYRRPDIKRPKRNGIGFCMRDDYEQTMSQELRNCVLEKLKNAKKGEVRLISMMCGYKVYEDMREQTVMKKMQEFSKCKLVVTDRLHGLIFATVTGTPCITFPNSSGKVEGAFRWISQMYHIKLVNNEEEFDEALATIDTDKEFSYNNENMIPYYTKLEETICQKKQR